MHQEDPRVQYLIRYVANAFGSSEESLSSLHRNQSVQDFVTKTDCNFLQVSLVKNEGKAGIVTGNIIRDAVGAQHSIYFTRISAQPELTLEEFKASIMVNSTPSNIPRNFYTMLHHVYLPLFQKQKRLGDPKMMEILGVVHSSLESLVTGTHTDSADKTFGIFSVTEDYNYWLRISQEASNNSERTRAKTIAEFEALILPDLEQLEVLDIEGINEKIENITSNLTEIWNSEDINDINPYPQERMRRILEIIGGDIGRTIQRLCSAWNVWDNSEALEQFDSVVRLGEKWLRTTEELTTLYWRNDHKWQGPKYEDKFVKFLTNRIEDVQKLLTSHDQLLQNLSKDEIGMLRNEDAFKPFRKLDVFYVSDITEPQWQNALSQYYQSMRPLQQQVASKLGRLFAECKAQPQVFLYNFQKNQDLIAITFLKSQLTSERRQLLSHLIWHINKIRNEFDTKSTSMLYEEETRNIFRGIDMSDFVNKIVWSRQLEQRVEEISILAKNLLDDFDDLSDLLSKCDSFRTNAQVFEKEKFQEWLRDVQREIQGDSQFLKGNIMDISRTGDGGLSVNYSEKIVALLREVRQLSSLGFRLPRSVLEVASVAEQYHSHGIILNQIANFYNTIDSQMIQSQRPMLLNAAREFENVVMLKSGGSGKRITWNNPREAEEYIQRLQRSAEKLTSENRKLRNFHQTVADRVVRLMDIDLLADKSQWKSELHDIRSIFDSVAAQGIENMDLWKKHWDLQLFKVLQFQYNLGLENLTEMLAEIKTDLVIKRNIVDYKPSMETLREKYYGKVKEFITMPTHFTGIDGTNMDIFAKMPDLSSNGLFNVYRNSEKLFFKLDKMKRKFEEYAVLSHCDLTSLVDENVQELSQWRENFKMIKSKLRDLERLDSLVKIGCISVSTSIFKNTVEEQLNSLHDTLATSLREAAQQHLNIIQGFLSESMKQVSKRPTSMEEIGKANATFKQLYKQKNQVHTEFGKFEEKNKLLKIVTSVPLDPGNLKDNWEQFESALEAHNAMIVDSIESLRKSTSLRVQEFMESLSKFASRWYELKPKNPDYSNRTECKKCLEFISEQKEECTSLRESSKKILQECDYFDVEKPNLSTLDDLDLDFTQVDEQWAMYKDYVSALEHMEEQDWISFRTKYYIFEDFLTEWREKTKQCRSSTLKIHILDQLDRFQEFYPCLKYLRGDEMWTAEHWNALFKLLRIEKGITYDKLLFKHFIERSKEAVELLDEVKEIHSRAQGESNIRKALHDLRLWENDAIFTLLDHEENGVITPIVTEWKDVISKVGDNQSLLQSLKESPYYQAFSEDIDHWESKLSMLDEYLQYLLQIQRKWLYLEPIFGKGALPSEQARFIKVNDNYRNLMGDLENDPRVIKLAKPKLRDRLRTILDQLERCQRALNNFLEEKRGKFPRFYFIGDDDLLEILGQAHKPEIIQTHLKKLFAGIHTVDLIESETMKQITSMNSSLGEQVKLSNPVIITEEIEIWLSDLDRAMKDTLRDLLANALAEKQIDISFIYRYPSQVLNLAENIRFTANCEKAISEGSLDAFKGEMSKQLQSLTAFDFSGDAVLEAKIKSIILDLIHNIDVLDQLRKSNVQSLSDWAWYKQLRYYHSTEGKCTIRMCDASFEYTFEYQGNSPKLVHTPLTDKCYLTLTQGMHLGYGGNPYGPAGTGKTESVKALANCLGRQVLVFNCDEGIDFHSMGRIFIGLVKCGAWGCFDEFNRLKEDQLSAVSQQIQVIQAAIKAREPSIELLQKVVDVDHNAGIFVTMNPAGKGYGGRSKLPTNLKQLFRSVAMSKPDNELIAEVILYSEGFRFAKELAKKVVSVFTLAKQMLSSQQHYDWGLRALKTVLKLSGQLVRTQKIDQSLIDDESKLLINSLRVNTLPKLTFEDSTRFNFIIADVFPGVQATEISYEELENALAEALSELNFKEQTNQIKKVLQFYEACNQRMGVVIVGPSGSGKSSLWRLLYRGLTKIGQSIQLYIMNPKSMPKTKLLGHMNMDTREFTDGILTSSARKVVREPQATKSWIICDGDIDPEWIEALNSVLDDNQTLTMPTGERIKFGPNVNFIFETDSLEHASPATISRMGVLFLSENDMSSHIVVQSWLQSQPEASRMVLDALIEDHFYKALHTIEDMPLVMDTTKIGLVRSGISQIRSCKSKAEFIQGLVRGFGGYLQNEQRIQFARTLYSRAMVNLPSGMSPLDVYYDSDSERFISYTNDSIEDDNSAFSVVPTADVQKYSHILGTWLVSGDPFIIVGPEGCGKSMIVEYLVSSNPTTQLEIVECNAQTHSSNIIQKLIQVCALFNTNNGKTLRPKEGEKLVFLLKDINLPKPDEYGTAQLTAFLQQVLTYQGFYDNDLEWMSIEGIQFIATMNTTKSVGRYTLSSRLVSLMRILNINAPNKDSLSLVCEKFLEKQLSHSSKWATFISSLSKAMVDVFDRIRSKFTQKKYSHYIFTPRDLMAWIKGLQNYDLETLHLLDAWVNEARRLFRDKIVEKEGAQYFEHLLESHLEKWNFTEPESLRYFTSFLSATESGTNRCFISMEHSDFQQYIQKGIKLYERENNQLPILLIEETLEHIARIDRALSCHHSSLLLIGRAGMGLKHFVSLVAFLLRLEIFSPKISNEYNKKHFQADIKKAIISAGSLGKPSCLIIEDYQLVEPTFLEMVNSLLTSGEIPGLFTQEELNQLLSTLQEEAVNQGNYGSVYNFFTSRVKENLRIALIMDPTDNEFETKCQSNPALFKKCNVQWIDHWNEETMREIPRILLKQLLDKLSIDSEQLIEAMVQIHKSTVSCANTTTGSFLSFVELFKQIMLSKERELNSKKGHLNSGLRKLAEAASTVDTLSKDAQKRKSLLSDKQAEADEALVGIQESMQKASEQRVEMEQLQSQLSENETLMAQQKEEIEQELGSIRPELEKAKKAVQAIDPKNLREIVSFKTPPPDIRHVMSGVLKLMGESDETWAGIRSFLKERGAINRILNFDARTVDSKRVRSVDSLVRNHPDAFDYVKIKSKNVATAPLSQWVKANVKYCTVVDRISPLENKQATLKSEIDNARKRKDECETKVVKLDQEVDQLRKEFAKKTSEAESLKISLEKAQATLQSAQNLLSKLSNEQVRWQQQVDDIEIELHALPLYALVSGACVTYLSAEPEDTRANYLQNWLSNSPLNSLSTFDMTKFLSSESEMLSHRALGLPTDQLSMENAVMILSSHQSPLVVDPAQAASEWLKSHLGRDAKTEITNPNDARFVNTVELSVRFGKTLVIEEVDSVPPFLYPLLRKEFILQGTRKAVQLGEKLVDFHDDFKIYLLTRDSSISLPPSAKAILLEVNFTITRSGLEGQLLGETIKHEEPELEKRKSSLLQKEEELRIQLLEMEKQLLDELANSSGDILENKALIERLEEIKSGSQIIASSLAESERLQASLDEQRNQYRPLAKIGSKLFFLVDSITKVGHMYQFNLSSFMKLFRQIFNSNGISTSNLKARIALLQQGLQKTVYTYVSYALLNEDKLLFAMYMVYGLQIQQITNEEWAFFIGDTVVEQQKKQTVTPRWVPKEKADVFNNLMSTFPNFSSIFNFSNEPEWHEWVRNAFCERNFSSECLKNSSNFQRVLLVSILRPDRLYQAMADFVCKSLGLDSLSAQLHLDHMATKEASEQDPILLISTPGADPSQELQEVAKRLVGSHKFHQLAMGQGQTEQAVLMLHNAAQNGDWIFLKNLHLVVSWLPTLEKELKIINPQTGFRLWLSSEPHENFPSMLLQHSLKLTFEPPPGIRNNLLRSYDMWTPEYIQTGSPARARMLFLLAWFHAILQERRRFIPQGFTKFYEFSSADIRAASDIVTGLACAQPDWPTVYGLLENAIYGGQIDQKFDLAVIKSYMRIFFNQQVLEGDTRAVNRLSKATSIPQTKIHADYVSCINVLSDTDSPTMFSLPANSDKVVDIERSNKLIESLKSLLVESVVQSSGSQWKAKVRTLLQLWHVLVQDTKIPVQTKARSPHSSSPSDNAMLAFIELEEYNGASLLSEVHNDFTELENVIQGSKPLSESLRDIINSLLLETVPEKWTNRWEGPPKIKAWMRGLVFRAERLHQWTRRAKDGTLLQQPVKLNELFNPHTFLNALHQQTARHRKCPLDALKLVNTWKEMHVPQCVEVKGLMIQGASFNGQHLVDVSGDAPPLVEAPSCFIAWVTEDEGKSRKPQLTIPVYLDSGRESLLAEFSVPSHGDNTLWTLRSVALFLEE